MQGKHLPDPLPTLCAAPGAQSNDRSDCPSALLLDLEDLAPGSPLQGIGPNGELEVQAAPSRKNDPRTPNSRLSGRTGEISSPYSGVTEDFRPCVYYGRTSQNAR